MVAAHRELGDELKPPAKIGHAGDAPAVGWLSNLRVSDDGTKLLSDVKHVPRRFADLVKAKAYRTRSVELSKITSQRTGKKFGWAVTGLAWLGGKVPAVRTLDDVVTLYEGDDDGIERRFVEFDETGEGPKNGEVLLLNALTEVIRDYVELASRDSRAPSDTRPVPGKYTDEQRRAFADAAGIEDADKVTDEQLEKAGVPSTTEVTEKETKETTVKETEGDERENEAAVQIRSLEERVQAAEKKADDSAEKLRLTERRQFVEETLRAGKIEPGGRKELEELFDANPDQARKFVTVLRADDSLGREYGADGDGSETTEEDTEKRDLAEREQIAREYGMKLEEVA